jgi:hypothetical protein
MTSWVMFPGWKTNRAGFVNSRLERFLFREYFNQRTYKSRPVDANSPEI